MSQIVFDEGMAEALEVIYRKRDVLRRRRLVREALAAQPGERILDVGCGPGFYVAELLEEVGPSGAVTGVDGSAAMLSISAKRIDGAPNVTLAEGDATAIPVPDGAFDAALSVQVLEYVDDATAALRDIHRALRPGGRVVIWDVDWGTVSWHSADQERMARALAGWDKHLVHPSLPQTLAPRLREAGFEDVHAEGHVFATTELDEETYGGAFVGTIYGYLLQLGEPPAEEVEAWFAEQRELGEQNRFFFSVTQFCFTARKPG